MNALEIVHLRSSGEPIETLGERIRESIEAEGFPIIRPTLSQSSAKLAGAICSMMSRISFTVIGIFPYYK